MEYTEAQQHRRDCSRCGHLNGRGRLVECAQGPHYARIVCPQCESFWDWVSAPERENGKRPAAHRNLVKRFGRGFCEMCLRKESELGESFFVGHHVHEYHDGGDPSRENVWILCKGCERLVHWARTYFAKNGGAT